MHALKIDFQADEGPRLLLTQTATGRESLLQSALVTAATATGSDPVDPTRGTSLLKTTTAAATVTGTTLRHACNFAALAVLFNSRSQRRLPTNLHLTRFTLTPVLVDTWNARTRITIEGAFNDGTTFGTSANL